MVADNELTHPVSMFSNIRSKVPYLGDMNAEKTPIVPSRQIIFHDTIMYDKAKSKNNLKNDTGDNNYMIHGLKLQPNIAGSSATTSPLEASELENQFSRADPEIIAPIIQTPVDKNYNDKTTEFYLKYKSLINLIRSKHYYPVQDVNIANNGSDIELKTMSRQNVQKLSEKQLKYQNNYSKKPLLYNKHLEHNRQFMKNEDSNIFQFRFPRYYQLQQINSVTRTRSFLEKRCCLVKSLRECSSLLRRNKSEEIALCNSPETDAGEVSFSSKSNNGNLHDYMNGDESKDAKPNSDVIPSLIETGSKTYKKMEPVSNLAHVSSSGIKNKPKSLLYLRASDIAKIYKKKEQLYQRQEKIGTIMCSDKGSTNSKEKLNEVEEWNKMVNLYWNVPTNTAMGDQRPSKGVFYVSPGNGGKLVAYYLIKRGWKQSTVIDMFRVRLFWVEGSNKCVTVNMLRKGIQLYNHIPDRGFLNEKIQLTECIRFLCRKNKSIAPDFYPETYIIGNEAERLEFIERHSKGEELWICKHGSSARGQNIFLSTNKKELERLIGNDNKKEAHRNFFIAQKYISSPLLLENRKFDLRVYLLIACTDPVIVLYHPGYARLTCREFDINSSDLKIHLTNQAVQKKDPLYQEMAESTVWTLNKVNQFLNEQSDVQVPKNWAINLLQQHIKTILSFCCRAIKHRIRITPGAFELFGCDFLIDSNLKVYLIECNSDPDLTTTNKSLARIIPQIVFECLDIVNEIKDKQRTDKQILPFTCLKDFSLLQ